MDKSVTLGRLVGFMSPSWTEFNCTYILFCCIQFDKYVCMQTNNLRQLCCVFTLTICLCGWVRVTVMEIMLKKV